VNLSIQIPSNLVRRIKMKTFSIKRVFLVLGVFIFFAGFELIGCAKKCPDPTDTSASNAAWDISPNPQNAELNPPTQSGGTLTIGHNNAVENRLDGDPKSKGTKTFNCGSGGSHCNIHYAIAMELNPTDDEYMEVKFSYSKGGTTKTRTIVHKGQITNPAKVSLPSCGEITMEVTVREGKKANIQSRPTIRLNAIGCADCAIKERGVDS